MRLLSNFTSLPVDIQLLQLYLLKVLYQEIFVYACLVQAFFLTSLPTVSVLTVFDPFWFDLRTG